MSESASASESAGRELGLRHLRLGLWLLAVSACGGVILEALHAFKAGAYLEPGAAPRRLMWTLAHAHGSLLGILNMALGACVARGLLGRPGRGLRAASGCLLGASAAMPAGFALGGVGIHGGDPGLGIVLVPPAGAALVAGLVLAALAVPRR